MRPTILNWDLLDRHGNLLDIGAKRLMLEKKNIYSNAPDNQKGSEFRMKLSLKLQIRMRRKVASFLSCPASTTLAEVLNRDDGISHSMLTCSMFKTQKSEIPPCSTLLDLLA